MGLFSTTRFDDLEDLLYDQLQDLYDAEQRLVKVLPKMARSVESSGLAEAFEQHQQQTKEHVNRLVRIFGIIGKEPQAKTCEAMKGLIAEASEVMSAKGESHVKDAAVIAAAQRIEHYEMAGYGAARNFAQLLGHDAVAGLLQETLDEEGAADQKLTDVAEQRVNLQAADA